MRSFIQLHSGQTNSLPGRESEYDYFMRAAQERVQAQRRERRARMVRKLTGRRHDARRAG